MIRVGIKFRNADLDGVAEGFKLLTRDEVPDMYDPALVEFSLEICADALVAANRAGTESILRESLQGSQSNLVKQLYRIEVPKPGRAASKAALKRKEG